MRRGAVGVEEGRGEGNWRGEGKGGLSLGRRAVRVGVWCGPWGCADVPWKRAGLKHLDEAWPREGSVVLWARAGATAVLRGRDLDACEWGFWIFYEKFETRLIPTLKSSPRYM